MNRSDDPLLRRLREAVLRMAQMPVRVTEPVNETEANARKAVRQLARSRVSLLLRQLRAAYGLSYEQIQARTGLSQQLLFDVEYKDRRLTLDELRALAQCYDISPSDVLGVDLD